MLTREQIGLRIGTRIAVSLPLLICVAGMLLFAGMGCRKKIVDPPETPPGRRDYSWTIETLKVAGTNNINMWRMWGSSDSDVYVIGRSDRLQTTFFHFDGKSWSTVPFSALDGGEVLEDIDWWGISGRGPNDVWVAGSVVREDSARNRYFDGIVLHFDGVRWRDMHAGDKKDINDIYEISPDNVWVVGGDGLLRQYTPAGWRSFEGGHDYFFSSVTALSPTEVYAVGYRHDKTSPTDSAAQFLYRFDGARWAAIDSFSRVPGVNDSHFGGLVSNWQEKLYSSSPDIWEFIPPSQWHLWLAADVGWLSGTSSKNLFAVGKAVMHYNGTDWYEYAEFRKNSWIWRSCYLTDTEVFILGSDGYNSFILHGK